jgi:hypothetical protein
MMLWDVEWNIASKGSTLHWVTITSVSHDKQEHLAQELDVPFTAFERFIR